MAVEEATHMNGVTVAKGAEEGSWSVERGMS